MSANLETLLQRIRDGVGSPEEVARARELAASDARLPEDLREIALCDDRDLEGDAAGLLSVLGADDLGGLIAQAIQAEATGPLGDAEVDDGWLVIADVLREGLAREATDVDVSDAVLHRLAIAGWAFGPVVAEAVRAEASEIDVAPSVMRELSLDDDAPVAGAVRAEAGEVDVAWAVMASLSLDAPVPLAEAVRAEVGEIDVAGAVLAEIGAIAPPVVTDHPVTLPAPANDTRGWSWAGFALAAAALVSVVVGALSLPGSDTMTSEAMLFAHAGEVVVEDLSYGDDVQVFQTEGGQGAVILWVDEEA